MLLARPFMPGFCTNESSVGQTNSLETQTEGILSVIAILHQPPHQLNLVLRARISTTR